MKFRTKILWISCIALLTASLLGDVLILRMTGKSLKNEAILRAYQNFYEIANALETELSRGIDIELSLIHI